MTRSNRERRRANLEKARAQKAGAPPPPSRPADSSAPQPSWAQRFWAWLWRVLKFLGKAIGIPSVAAAFAVWLALINLPPELAVEAVVDRSRVNRADSRIRIKNIGVLPAWHIQGEAREVEGVFGTIKVERAAVYPSIEVPRLAAGESTEVSVIPYISTDFDDTRPLNEFTYTLVMNYDVKFWFYKKTLGKAWTVELSIYPDGYAWDIRLLGLVHPNNIKAREQQKPSAGK